MLGPVSRSKRRWLAASLKRAVSTDNYRDILIFFGFMLDRRRLPPPPLGDGRGEVPGGDLGAKKSGQAGSAWRGLGRQPQVLLIDLSWLGVEWFVRCLLTSVLPTGCNPVISSPSAGHEGNSRNVSHSVLGSRWVHAAIALTLPWSQARGLVPGSLVVLLSAQDVKSSFS